MTVPSKELAMILLHWHGYNVSHAKDDIPNYTPVSNKWTKCEVRKFLKCIDSKPRKNFGDSLEVSKTWKIMNISMFYVCFALEQMPGRPMGDICQLYYSIAAPFKAPPRNKSHAELINQCFARAIRAGRVTNRWATWAFTNRSTRSAPSHSALNCRNPGEAEDLLEREFELHLMGMVGITKARRLIGRRMLSTPYPFCANQNGSGVDSYPVVDSRSTSPARVQPFPTRSTMNGTVSCLALPALTFMDYTIGNGSSGASSQLGSESTAHSRCPRHSLPAGVHYDHDEFVAFMTTPSQQLMEEREQVLLHSGHLDVELLRQIEDVDARAMALLGETELLKPSCGFPEVSYRWTKTELALVLTAMSRYGDDFATVARTVGSKTEGFIRDFYNQCRFHFPLDDIIRLAKEAKNPLGNSPDGETKPLISSPRPNRPGSLPIEFGPEIDAASTQPTIHSSPSAFSTQKSESHSTPAASARFKCDQGGTPMSSMECSSAPLESADVSMRTDDESAVDYKQESSSAISNHSLSTSVSPIRTSSRRRLSSNIICTSTRGRPRGRGRGPGRPRGRGRGRPSRTRAGY
ncbi:REST corepressor [Fasciola gigantica]|uniref:REST corepressor n=1 Tax=Fasciola gigantica TaxID=46835 RepID=A0A504YZ13_FASGI|nr:REST corepressor [Fasciola gigantica]